MDTRRASGRTGAHPSGPTADRQPYAADGAAQQEAAARLEQVTRELERSRARFQDVIERNADAILVVDPDGTIRFANAVAEVLFGSDRDRLCGTPFGFPITVGEATELDLPRRGDAHVVEMRVVESEWEGEPAYIASLRDITERKRAEEDARRLIAERTARSSAEAAARRFRFLAEASTLLSLPLDYRETLSTLARLCVTELCDWVGVYEVTDEGGVQRLEVAHRDPALADAVAAMREQPIEPGGPHPVLEVVRTRRPLLVPEVEQLGIEKITQDERHRDLAQQLGVASFIIVPLVARDRVLGAISLVSSTPDRRFSDDDVAVATDLALRAALAVDNARLYHEAQSLSQAKSDLLAVISHDLRTPLSAIMGHVDLLSLGIPDQLSDAGMQRVERIRMSAAHLLYLIDELLSFARIESGRDELRLQDVSVTTIVEEVVAVLEPLAHARSLALELDVPPHTVRVNTDPDRLRQVLLNVVGNAIKYTRQGHVRLRVRCDGADCVFDVADTGIGIPAEHLEHIFEPFWQADPTQRANAGGTGLGLAVVRRLVRLLGGQITVQSEPGVGSTFTLRLPRA